MLPPGCSHPLVTVLLNLDALLNILLGMKKRNQQVEGGVERQREAEGAPELLISANSPWRQPRPSD